jgi:hypothetical protein
VKNPRTGTARPYEGLKAFGGNFRVFSDQDSWNGIEERFKTVKDRSGKTMKEVCEDYWKKNPERKIRER